MHRQAPDPLKLAQRVAHGDLDADTIAWLAEGFTDWLAGEPLPDALGLVGMRARNRALREAADVLDPGGRPWARAELLAVAIRRYEARIQPLLQSNPAHPIGPLDEALQRAYALGYKVPRTARGLISVLEI